MFRVAQSGQTGVNGAAVAPVVVAGNKAGRGNVSYQRVLVDVLETLKRQEFVTQMFAQFGQIGLIGQNAQLPAGVE